MAEALLIRRDLRSPDDRGSIRCPEQHDGKVLAHQFQDRGSKEKA